MITGLTVVRAALAALFLACLIAAASSAVAQKEWTVHSFPADGSQGFVPMGNLIADTAGNLYGTTKEGGSSARGTVYKLVRPVLPKTEWTETVLYRFTGGSDGAEPSAGLVFDNLGNLYGTTPYGGVEGCQDQQGCGVVFELSPPATAGSAWTESVLHRFGGPGNGDGAFPRSELIWDAAGNLYGTTLGDGAVDGGWGTVFRLSPPTTSGGVWTETILHSFGNYRLGVFPNGPVFDSQGNLYGTTVQGGSFDTDVGQFHKGVVYRLTRPATPEGTWTYKILHEFGPNTAGISEGAYPEGGLTLHGKRIIYGTTSGGGLLGFGTVFQLSPPAMSNGPWTENILYTFDGASDGGDPPGKLIFDPAGNIYGTTNAGGESSVGSVFELTPPASDGPWTETTLHSFGGGKDGANPSGGLIFGKNGVLFGVTGAGGTGNLGAVFGLLP
jgi:uncharacterized repeat protein (TIGR03803 family)